MSETATFPKAGQKPSISFFVIRENCLVKWMFFKNSILRFLYNTQ